MKHCYGPTRQQVRSFGGDKSFPVRQVQKLRYWKNLVKEMKHPLVMKNMHYQMLQ